MQEMQGNIGHEGGSGNSHNSRAHVQVPELRNPLRAENPVGETFQGVAHVQMPHVPTGTVFLFSFYSISYSLNYQLFRHFQRSYDCF